MQTSEQVAGEAREKLADRLSDAIGHYGKEITTAWDWNPSAVKDLRVEISYADAKDILAALRAQPERGAEEWNYDMSAAPKGPGCPVLVSVPSFAKGHAPFVGEAYYHEDEPNEGWWWAGTSPSDYWASPIREVNAEPVAWRRLPEPAAIRALPLHPAKDEGGGR